MSSRDISHWGKGDILGLSSCQIKQTVWWYGCNRGLCKVSQCAACSPSCTNHPDWHFLPFNTHKFHLHLVDNYCHKHWWQDLEYSCVESRQNGSCHVTVYEKEKELVYVKENMKRVKQGEARKVHNTVDVSMCAWYSVCAQLSEKTGMPSYLKNYRSFLSAD